MGHPLIPKKERVCNNIDINGLSQFMIITGSNMAGKSTYLRTVGINLVLAMCGSVVCANKFEFFPIQVYSSMRVWDSLNKGESTFYAELKRLKEIMEYLDKENTLIFLDEILKGTNSRDKHIGSESLIKHLIINKGVGLIATHDLALTDMESRYPENIKNYSFEVKIKNERFIFDYKLQQSICRTLNATHLMKKMGLSVDE